MDLQECKRMIMVTIMVDKYCCNLYLQSNLQFVKHFDLFADFQVSTHLHLCSIPREN